MRNILLRFSALALLSLVACADDTVKTATSLTKIDCGVPASCSPTGDALIEITCPTGGEKLSAGDTLVVRWRATVTDFSGFRPQISLDGGTSFKELADSSVWSGPTPTSQCLSYPVVIQADSLFMPNASDNANVMIRIRDYSASSPTMRATTPAITILAD